MLGSNTFKFSQVGNFAAMAPAEVGWKYATQPASPRAAGSPPATFFKVAPPSAPALRAKSASPSIYSKSHRPLPPSVLSASGQVE